MAEKLNEVVDQNLTGRKKKENSTFLRLFVKV